MAVVIELDEFGLVDGSDTELTLNGRNKRRALEEGTGKSLECVCERCFASRDCVVESDDCDVLLACALLCLDESCGAIDTDDCREPWLASLLVNHGNQDKTHSNIQ